MDNVIIISERWIISQSFQRLYEDIRMEYRKSILPRFSGNSEAFASEFLETLDELFPLSQYLMVCQEQMLI